MIRFPLLLICLLSIVLLPGCAASEEMSDRPARQRAPQGFQLTVDADEVASVQLHAGSGENALPVLQLGRGVPLRLAFDIMSMRGRPLTVTFYHANREWKRDLLPAEYLSGFHRDDIMDYRSSRATFVDYVHYEYEFPNSTIDFRLSGNYILRVSEQGREDDVLFERAFFITEQSTAVDMRVDNVLVAGRQYSSIQPFVRFAPPDPTTNIFDYTVCFVRDTAYDSSRCVDNPSLDRRPDLQYYLEPRESFAPQPAPYYLNIGDIRTGGRIERTDQQSIPWRVTIEPDYVDLGASSVAPFLNGQALIRGGVRSIPDPDYSGEYIDVTLRLVPPNEQPLPGDVFVVGTFSNWEARDALVMQWNPTEGWYEAVVSMKQGQHEYRYVASDLDFQRTLMAGAPQMQNLFTTFVYLNDIARQTDRLVAVQGMLTR